MKKYIRIVNRVIFATIFVVFFTYSQASKINAQADRPMIDRGDGYGVMPGARLSPTTALKKIKEAQEAINDLKMFELNLTEEELRRFSPTPTIAPTIIIPDVIRDLEQKNPIIFDKIFDSALGNLIQKITQNIHNYCIQFGVGIIKKSNNSCVESIAPVIGQRGSKTVQHLKASTGVYNNIKSAYHETIQCVGCAVAMAEAVGYPYNGYGNAVNHINQNVPGYRYVSNSGLNGKTRAQLIPGTLFVTSGGAFGHIGMIVKVNTNSAGEANSFVSQECNWGKPGYFGFGRIIHFDQVDGFQVPITQ